MTLLRYTLMVVGVGCFLYAGWMGVEWVWRAQIRRGVQTPRRKP